jgi:hypothetical protein
VDGFLASDNGNMRPDIQVQSKSKSNSIVDMKIYEVRGLWQL